jgi:hypothetical protein
MHLKTSKKDLLIVSTVLLISTAPLLYVNYFRYTNGVLSSNNNPSYDEVLSLLENDTVHLQSYNSSYICWQVARDFRLYAIHDGYRCGIVLINNNLYSGHTINCFETSDKGLIYIEPQTAQVVNVTDILYILW